MELQPIPEVRSVNELDVMLVNRIAWHVCEKEQIANSVPESETRRRPEDCEHGVLLDFFMLDLWLAGSQ